MLQACEAIAEAHALGIVHRDLKPPNLFLTRRGDGRPLVKVLDFGISKIEARPGAQAMQLTRTTEVMGSPSYMSPGAAAARRATSTRARTSGRSASSSTSCSPARVPFDAETVTELVLVVVTEKEPPVRSLRPDCPEGLEAIVARCLEKQPEHRFQSVVELVQALEPYAHGVQATITERVRAVAGASGRALPPAPSSGPLPSAASAPIPSATPPSRVNVHGGTSVAWGETQSVVGPAPHLAPRSPIARKRGSSPGSSSAGWS